MLNATIGTYPIISLDFFRGQLMRSFSLQAVERIKSLQKGLKTAMAVLSGTAIIVSTNIYVRAAFVLCVAGLYLAHERLTAIEKPFFTADGLDEPGVIGTELPKFN